MPHASGALRVSPGGVRDLRRRRLDRRHREAAPARLGRRLGRRLLLAAVPERPAAQGRRHARPRHLPAEAAADRRVRHRRRDARRLGPQQRRLHALRWPARSDLAARRDELDGGDRVGLPRRPRQDLARLQPAHAARRDVRRRRGPHDRRQPPRRAPGAGVRPRRGHDVRGRRHRSRDGQGGRAGQRGARARGPARRRRRSRVRAAARVARERRRGRLPATSSTPTCSRRSTSTSSCRRSATP